MSDSLRIEVVYAEPDAQLLVTVTLSRGATVADAIAASDIRRQFPNVDFDRLKVGIWGRPVSRSQALSAGDRVELYRPLQMDPKEARRQLAKVGLTMGAKGGD